MQEIPKTFSFCLSFFPVLCYNTGKEASRVFSPKPVFPNIMKAERTAEAKKMELILISEEKLKITLSKEETSAYSLEPEKADYDDTHTRRALWSIFDDAKKKTGFDAAKGRIYLQIYPLLSGGCELCVTRLREKGRPEASVERGKSGEALLAFASPAPLLPLCASLLGTCECRSEAYLLPDGGAALLLIGILPANLGEYAPISDSALCALVREHGTLLCEDAVKRFAEIENTR